MSCPASSPTPTDLASHPSHSGVKSSRLIHSSGYTNILAALLDRQRTGRGRHIDISMLEALGEWMSYPLYYAFDGASPPARTGANHATIYPYGLFPTGDGKTVLLGLQNEREWVVFCETVLQQPALAND